VIASPAALFAARLALAAIVLTLVWRVIQVNAVLYEASGEPKRIAAAGAADGERSRLQEVIRANPADVAAMLVLARELESQGKILDAQAAYRTALDLAPLDQDVLAHAAVFFLRRDDRIGVELLGRILDQVPALRDRAFATLHEMIKSRRQQAAVVALFERDPAWLGAFITDACTRGVDPALFVPLMLQKARGGAPLANASCAIERLRASGNWDAAYQLWLNTLPRERLTQVGFIFNGGFEYAVSGVGFDWMLQQRDERETGHVAETAVTQGGSGKRGLRVAYNGKRQSGIPVRQYLTLAPGSYELTGLARPQGIVAPRGIQWTLRCADAAQPGRIASSERFIGSSEWRPFAVDFRVDGKCPAQLLQLEPAVEEGAVAFVAGIAWFDDLAIRRRRD
jgi:hypothetical protein